MKRIQSITDTIITNNHPFGTELQEFCQQDEHIALFPGHGLMDGGVRPGNCFKQLPNMDVLTYAKTNIPAELTKRLRTELGNFEMDRLNRPILAVSQHKAKTPQSNRRSDSHRFITQSSRL